MLRVAQDDNPTFNYSLQGGRFFGRVFTRPLDCAEGTGFCTSNQIGQDSGDVFAMMALGYNFDGIQTPVVARLGDGPADPATTVLSVPNFYGAHGHDPRLPEMSATFIAAGPSFKQGTSVNKVRNIDVAPTIDFLLGVRPSGTVDGKVLR